MSELEFEQPFQEIESDLLNAVANFDDKRRLLE